VCSIAEGMSCTFGRSSEVSFEFRILVEKGVRTSNWMRSVFMDAICAARARSKGKVPLLWALPPTGWWWPQRCHVCCVFEEERGREVLDRLRGNPTWYKNTIGQQ
jgi:hypothetical protein